MKANVFGEAGETIEVDVLQRMQSCCVTITEPLDDDDTKQQRLAKQNRSSLASVSLAGVRLLIAVLQAAEREMAS